MSYLRALFCVVLISELPTLARIAMRPSLWASWPVIKCDEVLEAIW